MPWLLGMCTKDSGPPHPHGSGVPVRGRPYLCLKQDAAPTTECAPRPSGGEGAKPSKQSSGLPRPVCIPGPNGVHPGMDIYTAAAYAIALTPTHSHQCRDPHTIVAVPPPLGTAGAYRTTANAGKSPCVCILIRAWPKGTIPGPYTSARQRQRHAHDQAQPGQLREQPGPSGLLRPYHRTARGRAHASPCPKRCSAPTSTPLHNAQSRAVGSANAQRPQARYPDAPWGPHRRPRMPGPGQRAPTPMPQRPGPAQVKACAERRRVGGPGFHTLAQLQQVWHRRSGRRQRRALRRYRQRQRSRRVRAVEVRPHRTPLDRGSVRGVARGAGGAARRAGRRHHRHPAPLPGGALAAGPWARAGGRPILPVAALTQHGGRGGPVGRRRCGGGLRKLAEEAALAAALVAAIVAAVSAAVGGASSFPSRHLC